MGDPSFEIPLPQKSTDERLDSWKEIAAYLNRDVTTVQRWEKREGMPVHRHLHDKRGSVYASRAELDAWARSRHLPEAEGNGSDSDGLPHTGPLATAAPDSFVPGSLPSRWKRAFFAAGAIALAVGAGLWLQRTQYSWRNPIGDAKFQIVTDFNGTEQAGAVSRDGHFIAFLSDRDGQMDVWVTQVGSGEYYNLTHGSAPELVNPSLRTVGFSPDGSLVTFWVRKQDGSQQSRIGIWAVPTLGGEPRPYLDDAAEFDWSADGSHLAYHTPGPGDPLFISEGGARPGGKPIFTAPAGLHAHFPLWSPDGKFIYFVQGSLPDKLDIWRIPSAGGTPERITSQNTRIIYPVLLDKRTLAYLATDPDGSGPWLYSVDVEHRVPHRLAPGLERYTSLAASGDGHRLVATLASPKRTLWRLRIADSHTEGTPTPIPLSTDAGFSPRRGPGYLLYVSATSKGDTLWKLTGETTVELWHGLGDRVVGGPAISPDGRKVAFTVKRQGKTLLYVVQNDGTNPRIAANSLNLQGDPAWSPDGQSIASAVVESGVPHLYRIPVNGGTPTPLVQRYALDPAWGPRGNFLVYSGPDIGTTFSLAAVTAQSAAHPLPAITLTRGARRMVMMPDGHTIVVMQGMIQHKDLWLIDLNSGSERQLTELPPEFDIGDFDVSSDGREVVLERVEERSDLVLIDRPRN